MAPKTTQEEQPLAPANGEPRSDEEANTKELQRKKRIKLAVFIAAFAVFLTIVILVFVFVVMLARTPKFRLGSPDVQTLNTDQTSPSFVMSFTTQLTVKNTNFGPYKYDRTSVTFTYRGVPVGQVTIPEGKAGFRATRKVNVTAIVSSTNGGVGSSLASDLSAGVLPLNSHATVSGKVELVYVFKKKKSTEMDCTMDINVVTKKVQDLNCK